MITSRTPHCFLPPPAELGVGAEKEGGNRRGGAGGPRQVTFLSGVGGLSEPKRNGLALRRRNRLMTDTTKIRQGKTLAAKRGGKGVSGCLSAEDFSPGISA